MGHRRHRHSHMLSRQSREFSEPLCRELSSIIALARLTTTMPIGDDDSEAAYEQYTLTRPALTRLPNHRSDPARRAKALSFLALVASDVGL